MTFWHRYCAALGDRRPPDPRLDVQAWLWGVDDGANPREPVPALVARMAARWGVSRARAKQIVDEAVSRRERLWEARNAPSLWGRR